MDRPSQNIKKLPPAIRFSFYLHHFIVRHHAQHTPHKLAERPQSSDGHRQEVTADPRLTRIVQEDKVPWYKKPNLRFLYIILVPTALGVEWTSGFDSSMMNSLQAVESWENCKCPP